MTQIDPVALMFALAPLVAFAVVVAIFIFLKKR